MTTASSMITDAFIWIDTVGDGTTDDSIAIQSAIDEAAAIGVAACFRPNQNILVKNAIAVPNNAIIWGDPTSKITADLGILGSPENAIFVAGYSASGFTATLTYANTPGTPTLKMNAKPANGSIITVQGASPNQNRVAVYTVLNATGTSSPYTVTVDRPVLKQFATSDNVTGETSVPQGIRMYGNGMTLTGACDRFVELDGAQQCVFQDWRLISTVAHDMAMSFDNGGYGNILRDCFVDGAGVGGTSSLLALESNEGSIVEGCIVRNGAAYGISVWDGDNDTVIGCEVSSCQNGIVLVADGENIGCFNCKVIDCNVTNCSQNGISVDNGSSSCSVIGCSAYGCATYGFLLNSTGSPYGNRIMGCRANGNTDGFLVAQNATLTNNEASSNGTYGFVFESQADASGLYCYSSNGSGFITTNGSATMVTLRGVFAPSVIYGFGVNVAAGARVVVSGANLGLGSIPGFVTAGVLHVEDAVISSGGSYGVHATSGGTARLGKGCILGSASTPVQIDSGAYCNRGTVLSNGTAAAPISFPDLNAADKVTITPVQVAGYAPFVTKTTGTGFSIKSVAGDTGNAYDFHIQ